MNRTMITAGALALAIAATGIAGATGTMPGHSIKKHTITENRLTRTLVLKLHGANGVDGLPGAVGATGAQGATGATGLAGTNGTDGVNGAQGLKGLTGNAGTNGTNGTNGLAGAQGAPGTDGQDGTNGTNGAPGANGANGTYVVVTHVTGADSNVCGGDWANDSYTRSLAMTMQPDGSIIVVRTYQGTFTTIAGASTPNGACTTHQVGGKVGAFTGTDVVTVKGGHFYPAATCAANCTSDAMMTAFFPGGTRSLTNGWEYHYNLGAEEMIQADATNRGGNVGDITLG